jgi:alpha/beta superfamily hydrolase
MDNHVVYRIARALYDSGATVLRFNFRGVGRSSGAYGDGAAEEEDVGAALDFLEARAPGVPLWVAGFSFGSRVGLSVGAKDARVARLLGVGLALRSFDYGPLLSCLKPKAVVQGALDELGDEAAVRAFFESLRDPKGLWIVPGATHLFEGKLDALERAAAEAIVFLERR